MLSVVTFIQVLILLFLVVLNSLWGFSYSEFLLVFHVCYCGLLCEHGSSFRTFVFSFFSYMQYRLWISVIGIASCTCNLGGHCVTPITQLTVQKIKKIFNMNCHRRIQQPHFSGVVLCLTLWRVPCTKCSSWKFACPHN